MVYLTHLLWTKKKNFRHFLKNVLWAEADFEAGFLFLVGFIALIDKNLHILGGLNTPKPPRGPPPP